MKYLDSGSRDPAHALASWLEDVLKGEVAELRLQTGFFSLDGIGLLIPALEQCKQNDQPTKVLIGSNDASTLKDDVIGLVDAMGIPRNGAQLGVVSFGGAFFHPKTYHFKRPDGSQAAFVGSANLTASGLALHVEAGIALDTRDGDAPHHLSQIAAAIDSWFAEQRTGMTLVASLQTVNELVQDGVLALVRPPRSPSSVGGASANGKPVRPRLQRLYALPPVGFPAGQMPPQGIAAALTQPISPATVAIHGPSPTLVTSALTAPVAVPVATVAHHPSVPRSGFPPYLLFMPNATGPSVGASALTGSLLPGGSAGLIVQLNLDSARHFTGGTGTANISIPVATVSTFRFGISGIHDRPTCKFDLQLRYVGNNTSIVGGVPKTSVMGYGYTPTETGHGDIRMLVPAAVRSLGRSVQAAGKVAPTVGDLALLEWPTPQNPTFGLTFLDKQSVIYQQALGAFNGASAAGQIVGSGACWLSAGISPPW